MSHHRRMSGVLVRYFPAWTPGSGFKKQALMAKEMWDEMEDIPYRKLRHEMVRAQPDKGH